MAAPAQAKRALANPADVAILPFPAEELPQLWKWLNEYPKANFDDSGPKTLEDLRALWGLRLAAGYTLIGVKLGTKWAGAIAFRGVDQVGNFAGICFSKEVHGMGVAQQAVSAVLMALWAEGYRKIRAEYMADNRRVRHFLEKLGAVDEGYFKRETTRDGKPIDVRRVAFMRPRDL